MTGTAIYSGRALDNCTIYSYPYITKQKGDEIYGKKPLC